MDRADLIRVGVVSRVHGLRGAIVVRLDADSSSILEIADSRCFLLIGDKLEEYVVRGAQRIGASSLRIKPGGIDTREAAEALQNAIVLVSQKDLPPLAPEEFYAFRALGCEVITTDGRSLGKIAEILPTGANDVLVVRDGAAEILIPVIADVIKTLAFDAGRIVIEPIPGLLEP